MYILYIRFFLINQKVDPEKFPPLQNTERLTSDATKAKKEHASVGIISNNLAESQADEERCEDNPNEMKKDKKEINENKYINNDNGNGVHRNQKEENLRNAKRLTIGSNAFDNFGQELEERDNINLESISFLKLESHHPCEVPKEVNCIDFQETCNDIIDETTDMGIAKDILSFAWQIARGMVSNKELVINVSVGSLISVVFVCFQQLVRSREPVYSLLPES